MCSVQELQRVDRELFSELVETPINPAFFHMSTLFVDSCNPMFYLQISGEGLWQLRGYVSRKTEVLFAVLQDNLSKIGYQLTQSSSFWVGNIVKNRAQYIVNKTWNTSNGSVRKAMRSAFWCKVALHPEEIHHGPSEITSELKKREGELMRENEKLWGEVEGKKNCRSDQFWNSSNDQCYGN